MIAFDKKTQVLTEPTNDRKVLREAISRTRNGGGTSLYMAVDTAIQYLHRISGRKAVVLFTDGVDTASVGATLDSTVQAVVERAYTVEERMTIDVTVRGRNRTSFTSETC